MDKQVAARLRLAEVRLEALEVAVRPKPIRRTKTGLPRSPEPYEPGDDTPITDWLALRLMAFENLFGFVLQADARRVGEPADADIALHDLADFTLGDLEDGGRGDGGRPAGFSGRGCSRRWLGRCASSWGSRPDGRMQRRRRHDALSERARSSSRLRRS